MNSNLKDKQYVCPDEVINELEVALSHYKNGGDTKGFKRAKGIVNNPNISYQQIKRMKNYFDKYEGDGTDEEFKLNGGKSMRKWVNHALGVSRYNDDAIKKVKERTGSANAYKKEGERNSNKTATKISEKPTDPNGHDGKQIKTVYENEIKQIQYLIEYLDNNETKII